jgi:hypothetical protein
MSDSADQKAMMEWLRQTFPLKIEFDFWFQFYVDLDNCFDDLEPWHIWTGSVVGRDPRIRFWQTFDEVFTGRLIPADEGSECLPR